MTRADSVQKQRKARNLALAGALVAFALLIFIITIVRLGQHQ
jgi:hypothetical protein